MAAGRLQKPGSAHGPCVGDCEHTDCALTRRMIGTLCGICGRPIGYDVRFYDEEGELFHADCIERRLEEKAAPGTRPPGFPLTEACEHGAGAGVICEKCSGVVNFPLQILVSVTATVEELSKRDANVRTLTESVRVRDAVLGWATDREICFKALGPCACFNCVGDRTPAGPTGELPVVGALR